jgi:hypothetical protein
MNPENRLESTESPRKGPDVSIWIRRILPAGIAGFGMAAVLLGNERLRSGAMLLPASARVWVLVFLGLIAGVLVVGWRRSMAGPSSSHLRLLSELSPALLVAGLTVFLFSGAMLHPWTYFIHWLPHFGQADNNLWSGLPWFVLLTGALTPFLFKRRRLGWGLFGLLLVTQVACLIVLLQTTGGAALYKDDHPSFLFRFWEFGRTFPQYLNYNPWWNGGLVNAYCTTSGTGALGIPLYPLWRFFPVHEVYTAGLGLIYILAMPLLAAFALRIMGQSRAAAACAGLLALGVSRHFFLWLLHYGTVCAPLVASFTLLVSACLYRVLWMDRREKWLGAVLVGSVLMLLQWPPGGLMALPIAVTCLFSWRQWTWKKIRFILICAGIVAVLAARLILVILLKGQAVVAHVMGGGAETESIGLADAALQGFNYLVAHLQEDHPVLIFLGFAGLFVLSARSIRRWFWPALLCFILIVGWGPILKPKLELGRMAIPMMFLAVGPAAVGCSRLLRGSDWRLAPARAALLVLLALGGWNVARLYGSQGSAPYRVMHERIETFADRLHDEVPEGGRVLFAGPMVHHLGWGHVAYLPVLTGREMMAVDYYHFPTSYVKYEYPPDGFNETPDRVREFIRLYNITHVVTYHDRWKACFRMMEQDCEELDGFEAVNTSVFRMKREPSQFVRGSGRVTADFSRLDVQVNHPNEEAVLCYNWAEGLFVPEPVELFPYDAGHGVQLIGVRPNGSEAFSIRYRSLL